MRKKSKYKVVSSKLKAISVASLRNKLKINTDALPSRSIISSTNYMKLQHLHIVMQNTAQFSESRAQIEVARAYFDMKGVRSSAVVGGQSETERTAICKEFCRHPSVFQNSKQVRRSDRIADRHLLLIIIVITNSS
jgi:hypothetical protein